MYLIYSGSSSATRSTIQLPNLGHDVLEVLVKHIACRRRERVAFGQYTTLWLPRWQIVTWWGFIRARRDRLTWNNVSRYKTAINRTVLSLTVIYKVGLGPWLGNINHNTRTDTHTHTQRERERERERDETLHVLLDKLQFRIKNKNNILAMMRIIRADAVFTHKHTANKNRFAEWKLQTQLNARKFHLFNQLDNVSMEPIPQNPADNAITENEKQLLQLLKNVIGKVVSWIPENTPEMMVLRKYAMFHPKPLTLGIYCLINNEHYFFSMWTMFSFPHCYNITLLINNFTAFVKRIVVK